MTQSVTVRPVETSADYQAFFDFPWQVYKDDPNWTPQLLSMRRDILDKKRAPAWEYMEGDYLGAWRGDQLVGTIAAFINHRHNEFHQEHIGWFGAFEVNNDPEAAQALLKAAIEWVRSRGYDAIFGPQTFTTHEDVGLLVDGFEPPVLLMPYHKPYYQALIEQAGFAKAKDMFSFYYDWKMADDHNLIEKMDKMTARILQRGNVTLRPINRKNLRHDFELFKEIYNEAWTSNWGFVPMTDKELDTLIEGLSMIFDPDLACFAEVNGKPVGFTIVVPDFNQVLHRAYPHPGEPEILTLLKAAWHWKIRPVIHRVRVPLMGVIAEHRKKGFDLAMYYHLLKILKSKGYESVDCGWIIESNHDMIGIMKGFGMIPYRTHRLYEMKLKT
ncbi:MAG: GNAT family N-acetyltransferase [Anaerolineae bacterium]|nr:GNAT family N-acetyltransferase [Anaerolineae bacterium]